MALELVERSLRLLRKLGVGLSPGLTEDELERVERTFGFAFAADHRELLSLALPVGDGWVDWRGASDESLRELLDRPVHGALFDVRCNAFWAASWGPRPEDEEDALRVARERLERWPALVPVFGHRYLPAAPTGPGAPVFSVSQTDVIFYGDDLADYLAQEFGSVASSGGPPPLVDVPPWSRLAVGAEGDEL